jgi:hypothetical protein
MDTANEYELRDIAEMLATDRTVNAILALSRASFPARNGCHEAIRDHLARSEERGVAGLRGDRMGWLDERLEYGRYCDRPARIRADGGCEWMRNGAHHRGAIDPKSGCHMPAIIRASGSCEWWYDGKRHRSDVGPASPIHSGSYLSEGSWCARSYKLKGPPESDESPPGSWHLPAVIGASGYRMWFFDGARHRDDVDPRTGFCLPAVIYADGTREWMQNALTHRRDVDPGTGTGPRLLPAIIDASGRCQWMIKGEPVDSMHRPS